MPDEIVVESGWRDRVASLAGNRHETWVLVGVVAALLVGALVFLGRSTPAIVAPPARAAEPLPSNYPADAQQATAASVAVHVAGAVRNPGLYELPGDLRVADAIDAAGGPARRADLDSLNLAEPLADGAKIYVSRRGEAPAPAATTGPQVPAAGAGVSINSADAAALEQIPGIGPVKAAAIVDYRSQAGSFESIDQLLDVTGIGPATLESLRPYVTL